MAGKVVKDMNEDFLNCCICMTNFKTPKMLPCIHSFCEECLGKYAAKQGSDQIPCPTCRKVCKLPETGVKGLPTNFHLINLAERVKLLEKLTSTTKKASTCDSCKSPEVVAFCVDCNFAICSKCQDHHSLFPLLSSHSVIPLNQLNDPKFQQEWRHVKSPYCQLHSSEKLHFYCNTCSQMICRDCTIVLHSKPEHEYVEASSKFANIKDDLSRHLKLSKELLEKELLVLQRGVKGKEQLDQERARIEAELSLHCKNTIAAIEAEFSELKDAMVAKFAERANPVEAQIQYAENWVKRMQNTQEITQTVIQENNPWELLAMSADLSTAFGALKTDSKAIELRQSDLKVSTTFQPSPVPDLQLGELFCFPADAVVTDGREYFYLCDFNKSTKMLSIMRVSVNDSKLEYFCSYEWKDDYLPGANVVAAVRPECYLFVGLGKIVARFELRSKSFSTKHELGMEGCIQCITYDCYSGYLHIAATNGHLHQCDCNFASFSNFDLNGLGHPFHTHYYHLIYCNDGGVVKYYNYQKKSHGGTDVPIPDLMSLTDTNIVHSVSIHNTLEFFVLRKGSVGGMAGKGRGDEEGGAWVLQEFARDESRLHGILRCLGGSKVKFPEAVFRNKTSNGMDLYLCDDCGNVTAYKRAVVGQAPQEYEKL